MGWGEGEGEEIGGKGREVVERERGHGAKLDVLNSNIREADSTLLVVRRP